MVKMDKPISHRGRPVVPLGVKVKTTYQLPDRLFVGVDPGYSGAIACLACRDNKIVFINTEAFKDSTLHDLYKLFESYRAGFEDNQIFTTLEHVHAMPGQGVSSVYKFGYITGVLETCLVACQYPYQVISPRKWQAVLGCTNRKGKKDKNVTKAVAQKLFPSVKMTHAIADALLLAEYSRRSYEGRITS